MDHLKLTVGIWVGFPYKLALRREGISRFTMKWMESFILLSSNHFVELWCYSVNEEDVRYWVEQFEKNIPDVKNRIKIITEKVVYEDKYKNFNFNLAFSDFAGNEELKLGRIANVIGNADFYLIPIFNIKTAHVIKMPKVIAFHDLITAEHPEYFEASVPSFRTYLKEDLEAASNYARKNSLFIAHSRYVRNEHGLKFIQGIKEEQIKVVNLAVIPPWSNDFKNINEEFLRTKYLLPENYIFSPTQDRPYKGIETLLNAISDLKDKGDNVGLVLTCKKSSRLAALIEKLNVRDRVIFIKELTEEELYAMHRFAICSVSASAFEGSMPWQCQEGFIVDTPMVTAKIPVTLERVESFGLSIEMFPNTFFDLANWKELASRISYALKNRQELLIEQAPLSSCLKAYGWMDVVKNYVNETKLYFDGELRKGNKKGDLLKLMAASDKPFKFVLKMIWAKLRSIPVMGGILNIVVKFIFFPYYFYVMRREMAEIKFQQQEILKWIFAIHHHTDHLYSSSINKMADSNELRSE